MLKTAIVGLGWWGKTLVKAAREFGAPIHFVRGVSLEPDTVRDFAAEQKMALGTSLDEVLADHAVEAVILATPHSKHRRAGQSRRCGQEASLLREAVCADQG